MDRAQIKSISKEQLNKNFSILATSYLITTFFIGLPEILSNLLNFIIYPYELTLITMGIYLLIGKTLYIGLLKINLDIVKNKEVRLKDLLKGFKCIYNIYTTSFLLSLIIDILILPFLLIPIFMAKDSFTSISIISIITTLSSVFFTIVFSQLDFIIADKEDISPIEAMKKSMLLIKNHIAEYIVFMLSFIGWQIIGGLTIGIAFIWIGPYMNLSYANLYNVLKEDKLDTYNKSKLNKKAGLIIGLIICLGLAIFSNIENNLTSKALAPTLVKKVLKENNLKLISVDTDEYYYLDQSYEYYSEIDKKYFDKTLTRYICIVRNHKLDKSNKDIYYTVLEIVADNNKIINITTNPYDKTTKNKIDNYNYQEGKYDINGNPLK